MEKLDDLVGSWLINNNYEYISTSDLTKEGQIVGLYFSGIYPGGREFTALLVAFYNRFQLPSLEHGGKRLEVVFVSCDHREDAYYFCLSEMPWTAIPYYEYNIRNTLMKRYNVTIVPTLVLIDGATCHVINAEGREVLCDDPNGRFFPWIGRPLPNILCGELLACEKRQDCKDLISPDSVKGFYFAAQWCASCKTFTPWLKEVYQKVREDGRDFEIIFVSYDRSEKAFKDHYSTMPWLALPFNDPRIRELSLHFDVRGIPCFLTVDERDEIISCNNCQGDVRRDQEMKKFPWAPPLVKELDEESCCCDSTACLVLFTVGDKSLIRRAEDLLYEAAEQYKADQRESRNSEAPLPKLKFLYEGFQSKEVADTIRDMAQLYGYNPIIVIIDPLASMTYSTQEGNVSREALAQLIADFKKLYRIPLDQLQSLDSRQDDTKSHGGGSKSGSTTESSDDSSTDEETDNDDDECEADNNTDVRQRNALRRKIKEIFTSKNNNHDYQALNNNANSGSESRGMLRRAYDYLLSFVFGSEENDIKASVFLDSGLPSQAERKGNVNSSYGRFKSEYVSGDRSLAENNSNLREMSAVSRRRLTNEEVFEGLDTASPLPVFVNRRGIEEFSAADDIQSNVSETSCDKVRDDQTNLARMSAWNKFIHFFR